MQLFILVVAILGATILFLLSLMFYLLCCPMGKKKVSKWVFSGRVSRSQSLSSKDSLAKPNHTEIELQVSQPELLEMATKPETLHSAFKYVGQSSDPNAQFRRSMEDAHIVIDKFADDPNMAFFGVYDGHGGREVVDYVLQNLHKNLEVIIKELPPSTKKSKKKKKHSRRKRPHPPSQLSSKEDVVVDIPDDANTEKKQLVEITVEDKPSPLVLSESTEDIKSDEDDKDEKESTADEKKSECEDFKPEEEVPKDEETKEVVRLDKYQKALQESFLKTDQQIIDQNLTKSGCTAVACFLARRGERRYLYCANIGDSHAVLCRKGKAMLLSFEHKPTDAGEMYRLKTQNGGIFVFNNRVAGSLAVSRAFGNLELKKWVTAEPHLKKVALRSSDTFLILACDGLWDVCTHQLAADLVSQEMAKGHTNSQYLSDMLIQYALQHRTTDNLTVLVVVF